jgi:hypothetical protein
MNYTSAAYQEHSKDVSHQKRDEKSCTKFIQAIVAIMLRQDLWWQRRSDMDSSG